MDAGQGCIEGAQGDFSAEGLGVAAFAGNRVAGHAGAVLVHGHQVLGYNQCDGEKKHNSIHNALLSVDLRECGPMSSRRLKFGRPDRAIGYIKNRVPL
jgi:hypothetical protein